LCNFCCYYKSQFCLIEFSYKNFPKKIIKTIINKKAQLEGGFFLLSFQKSLKTCTTESEGFVLLLLHNQQGKFSGMCPKFRFFWQMTPFLTIIHLNGLKLQLSGLSKFSTCTHAYVHWIKKSSKCILRVLCCSKCLFLYTPFCQGALKRDPIYIVCNIFSLNFSSIGNSPSRFCIPGGVPGRWGSAAVLTSPDWRSARGQTQPRHLLPETRYAAASFIVRQNFILLPFL